jgi:Transposase, Mutator family
MDCLAKDKASMLAFYDYPTENWQHIRTTNPVESVFATVRLRTTKTRNCGNRTTILAMAFELIETAQKKWFRLGGYKQLADVVSGVKFVNGIKANRRSKTGRRLILYTPHLTLARLLVPVPRTELRTL